MTLIVEDGTGLATAEAYMSVADADAYLVKLYGSSATWTAATTAQKEAALRRGARYVDGAYSFAGTRLNSDQALSWPRDEVYDDLDAEVTGVPAGVENANAEIAIKIIAGTSVEPDVSAGGQVIMERIKADVLEQEKQYKTGASPLPYFPVVTRMLKPYLLGGKTLLRA